MKSKLFLLATGIILLSFPLLAKEIVHTKQLNFGQLTNKKTVVGTLKGFDTKNYKLNAKANQILRINLESAKVYFNVYEPYKSYEDGAMFMGTIDGTIFTRKLSKSGTYTIQVSLLDKEAEKDEKIIFTLDVGLE